MAGRFASINRVVDFFTKFIKRNRIFSSAEYWNSRYLHGGNSGPGSYGKLAEFKAEILNGFVAQHNVKTVIEFGCGDGNQLKMVKYPSYVGFDVSPKAVEFCKNSFKDDLTKKFALISEYQDQSADLALSLDVLFHLVEEDVFVIYMHKLFSASNRYVGIYSSNFDDVVSTGASHVRHRKFTNWVEENMSTWKLMHSVPNRFPYNGDYTTTSFCDFYFYEKVGLG